MKVSDYIVCFLEERQVSTVFGYPGGMVTHLMDSFSKSSKIKVCLNYHEQASAFCAVAYGQMTSVPTIAFATSGPGATNMITGICDAWFDSVPVVFITGQVNTYEGKGNLPVRQLGFQETDVVSLVKSVTKYAKSIENPDEIRYELEKAFDEACSGRPGPVLLDIPMNVFRSDVCLEKLRGYEKPKTAPQEEEAMVESVVCALKAAKRPMILAGNGIHQSCTEKELREIVEALQIPVVTSMPAVDLLETDYPYFFGFVGAYGQRSANILIDKSDLILVLGARLDNRQTGNDLKHFAIHGKLLRVECDPSEAGRTIKPDEIVLSGDLRAFMPALAAKAEKLDTEEWLRVCQKIDSVANSMDVQEQTHWLGRFSERARGLLSAATTDVGQNQVWAAQALFRERGKRILFSSGHGAMGYSLPAAIGASLALGRAPILSINGDGGIQMNIQELQTIARERLPVKILVLNNESLGMIRHFQEMYFESNYTMTMAEGGYTTPDFVRIADAYGIPAVRISMEAGDMDKALEMLRKAGPAFIEVMVGRKTYVKPKSVYNRPLSDQTPFMDENLYRRLMEL